MYKHCIKCGASLQDVLEDGLQRHICNACGWIYYNNPRPCVTAVIHQNHQILFIRRLMQPRKGKWDFPGGFMEIGETPEQALQRELNEELGVSFTEVQFLGFYPDVYDQEESIPLLNIVYIGQIEGVPKNCAEEFDLIQWFQLSELPKNVAFEAMSPILKDTRLLISTNRG